MSLLFKTEPSKVATIVKDKLDQMASLKAFRTPQLARALSRDSAKPPVPTQPLPVYHLGLADLAKDCDLSKATQTGWRYLLKHEDSVIASAETVIGSDRQPIFAQVNEGPLVKGTESAIRSAKEHKDVKKSEYEVRILMIPALYTSALWLVDIKGGKDMAIPIAPASLSLEPDKPITIEKLLVVLRKEAKLKSSTQRSTEPVGG